VADLVRALAVAWKNIAAYPAGHPALATSLQGAHRRLVELRGPAGEVVFGIAADGLIYGQERIESTHVQKFAQALFTRRVAVVRFDPDTTADDLEKFLRLLAAATAEDRTPLWEQLTAAGVMNINLQAVDYSSVQITDDMTERIKKSDTLWDDILRALLAGRELTPEGKRLLEETPRSVDEMTALVMRYIEEAEKEMPQFDADATFGIRRVASSPDPPDVIRARVSQAIALHVGNASGSKKQLAVQQVMQLMRTFPDPLRGSVMRSVLRELARDETTGSQLRDFASSLADEEVLDALLDISSMSSISSHAVRLLESLSALQDAKRDVQAIAPDKLLAELTAFFGDEDVDRFNPPEHATLLDNVSVKIPSTPSAAVQPLGDRADSVAPDIVNRAFGLTLLDLMAKQAARGEAIAPLLARIESVFLAYLTNGAFGDAADFVEAVQDTRKSAAAGELRAGLDEALGRLATLDSMKVLIDHALSAPPAQASIVQRLIEALGSAATRNLLEALAAENNRSRRRRLFDLVASLGPRIVDEAIPFLSDPRWFVVRNAVVLLRTVKDRKSLPQIRGLGAHPDLRVRLEAIKTLLAFDSSVPQDLLDNAIGDPDPKLAETAVTLVGSYGIKEAVAPMLRLLTGNDILGVRRALRVRVLKVLGELGDPRALPELARFFQRSLWPWPSVHERRTAFESLAGYPAADRAPFVEQGLSSRDAVVREICRKLSSGK
jgi:HEAT repeat protein